PRSVSSIYTPSLHDALPIFFQSSEARGARRSGRHACPLVHLLNQRVVPSGSVEEGRTGAAEDERIERSLSAEANGGFQLRRVHQDRKSTRLNSRHVSISYAV